MDISVHTRFCAVSWACLEAAPIRAAAKASRLFKANTKGGHGTSAADGTWKLGTVTPPNNPAVDSTEPTWFHSSRDEGQANKRQVLPGTDKNASVLYSRQLHQVALVYLQREALTDRWGKGHQFLRKPSVCKNIFSLSWSPEWGQRSPRSQSCIFEPEFLAPKNQMMNLGRRKGLKPTLFYICTSPLISALASLLMSRAEQQPH